MDLALLAAALLAGFLLAVQTSVNLRLNGVVRTPYGASTIQLAVAAGLLAILAITTGALGALRLDVEWWHLLGGLASPLYITSGILLFPRFGALASVGLFVTGQMVASLALDLFGWLGVPRQPVTAGILLGAVAVLAGITMIIRGSARTSVGALASPVRAGISAGSAGWILLGVVAGTVLPLQGAANAALRQDLGRPIVVALISFLVAFVTIALVLLAMLALGRTPAPRFAPLRTMPWWGWLGGACAATYVTATFLLIPQIGAATTIALTVTGQQLASAIIDGAGLFRLPRRALTGRRLLGLGLLIAGSVLVQLT